MCPYRLDVYRVNRENDGSDECFHVVIRWRHLATDEQKQRADGSVEANVDNVIAEWTQTSQVVVQSVATDAKKRCGYCQLFIAGAQRA